MLLYSNGGKFCFMNKILVRIISNGLVLTLANPRCWFQSLLYISVKYGIRVFVVLHHKLCIVLILSAMHLSGKCYFTRGCWHLHVCMQVSSNPQKRWCSPWFGAPSNKSKQLNLWTNLGWLTRGDGVDKFDHWRQSCALFSTMWLVWVWSISFEVVLISPSGRNMVQIFVNSER